MSKHTIEELRLWQSLPLSIKIRMTEERIRMWVREYGESGVYVSFSGGKDSTVLLDIVRNRLGYKDIPAVFVDTGLEYPEIREFVKTFDNVVWLKPKMQFRKVIETYGYPFISKEVSEAVEGARRYLHELTHRQTDRQSNLPYRFFYDKVCGLGEYAKSIEGGQTTNIESAEELANILDTKMRNREGGNNLRLARTLGWLTKDNRVMVNIPNARDRSTYACTRYSFFLQDDAPVISNKCCGVMKKQPTQAYYRKTKRHQITGEMASESRLRLQKWLQHGCNAFDTKKPKSTPLAFWTEQDILQYIKENNIKIASVYGDIVYDEKKSEQLEGQLEFGLNGIEEAKCMLKTTGCKRTGCMFCGFGCTQEAEGEGRFERMKETHPKQYEWIMKDWDKGGLGYKKVIDWINEHGNLNIRY